MQRQIAFFKGLHGGTCLLHFVVFAVFMILQLILKTYIFDASPEAFDELENEEPKLVRHVWITFFI
jgi:hypothetical protein